MTTIVFYLQRDTYPFLENLCEMISVVLDAKYGEPHMFSVLAILYPNLDFKNNFHQDHIFPKDFFKKSILKKRNIPDEEQSDFIESCNNLVNIQLLEGIPNEEKSNKEFSKWLSEICTKDNDRKEYMKKHFIPEGISLEFDNFLNFCEERRKLISIYLRTELTQ